MKDFENAIQEAKIASNQIAQTKIGGLVEFIESCAEDRDIDHEAFRKEYMLQILKSTLVVIENEMLSLFFAEEIKETFREVIERR